MLVMMWVLVLYLDPEMFYEQYRTSEHLEIGERAFRYEWECDNARLALERGKALGGNKEDHYACVYEEAFIPTLGHVHHL